MQGGEHLMAGERGAQGHGGGVGVADLADQDHVGVLAQQRAHAVGEVEPRGLADLGLADQGERVLDRVLQGHDVDRLGVEVAEHGVQRGGLAAASGADHQDQALGAGEDAVEGGALVRGEAERVERDDALVAVEDAQHDVLAVQGGLGGDAEVDRAAADRETDAPVLRAARLGDVHAGEHLDAHRQLRPARLVHCAHLAQRAVDAVAHAQEARLGLQVQVGGSARGGLGEQCVHQAHDQLRVARTGDGLAGAAFELAHHVLDRARLAVVLLDRAPELVVAGQAQLDVHVRAELGAQAIEGDDVVGVGHRDDEAVAGGVVLQRQQAVAAGERLRHARDRVGVGERAGEVHAGQAAARGERLAQRGLADEAELDQHAAERLGAPALLVEGDAELVLADQAGGDEDLADGERSVHGRLVAASGRPGPGCVDWGEGAWG